MAMSASAASSDAALLGRIASQVGAECGPHDIDLVLRGENAWPETPTYGVRLRSFGAFHEHVSRHEHGATQGHERRRMT